MDIGVSFLPRDVETMVRKAQLAEELGFDFFGVGDSQSISREIYATLGPVAANTDSINIGPWVTNPVTRHPIVTASASGTIHELSDGRYVLGIGAGDSAVYTLGEKPARLKQLEEAIKALKTAWRGEETNYEGSDVQLRWLEESNRSQDIPIMVAADGPKTMKTAGRIADGVIIGLGVTPDVIDHSIDLVNQGAAEAGRDPDDVQKWFLAQVNIADRKAEAVDDIKMALAASAHHSLQVTMENKCVPQEYKAPLKKIVEEYDPNQHEQKGESRNRELVEEYGLTEYLSDRYAVVGTPEDCIRKLNDIGEHEEVEGIVMPAHMEEKRRIVSRLGVEVLPHVEQ